VLLACTEAPIAMGAPSAYDRLSIDTTLALARATVRGWQAMQRGSA
jgi:hypothetical protein